MHTGWAQIGNLRFPAPEYNAADQLPALAYVRPHEIDLLRQPQGNQALAAIVSQVRTVGPVVRLELTRPHQEEVIEVELPRERYLQDPFQVGEQVFIRPRHLRVLLEDRPEKLPAGESAL